MQEVLNMCISIQNQINIVGWLHQHRLTFKSRLIPPLISTLRKLRFHQLHFAANRYLNLHLR